MWPPWIKTRSSHSPSSPSPSPSLSLTPHSPSLSFPTLKDLQSLLDSPSPSSPSSPSPPPLSSPSLRVFHRVRLAASALRAFQKSLPPPPSDHPHVVLYFTSLRVVRSTFTDCRSARSILKSLRVSFDERDVSLDHRFLAELQSLLKSGKAVEVSLPQLFIGGRRIGGADEIRRLHESGELKRLVEGAGREAKACQSCGGERFVVCERCDGSRKRYSERGGKGGGGFRVCNDCNENGLRRCADCCG